MLHFISPAGSDEECLKDVNLQPVLWWATEEKKKLGGKAYTAMPIIPKLSMTAYQNMRLDGKKGVGQ